LSRIDGNNNKMIEIYVRKTWLKNVVILGWFLFLAVFVPTVQYFRYVEIFNRINGKQQ